MAKSAAFSISDKDYKRLKAAAEREGKTVSTFMREIVWPRVEEIEFEIEDDDRTVQQIRKHYKAGGVTKHDLSTLYHKSSEEINAILVGQ
jgi:predicted DNA-binding protein